LSKKYPSHDAGLAFNSFANEIKQHEKTKDKIKQYIWEKIDDAGGLTVSVSGSSKEIVVPDMLISHGSHIAFDIAYANSVDLKLGNGDDLAYALGGGHFGHRNLKIKIDCHDFDASGTFIQNDNFTFPAGSYGVRLLDGDYGNFYNLEHSFHYPSFWHTEEFNVHVKGKYGYMPSGKSSYRWISVSSYE